MILSIAFSLMNSIRFSKLGHEAMNEDEFAQAQKYFHDGQIILELESEMLFLPCILGKTQSLEQIDKADHPMAALEKSMV